MTTDDKATPQDTETTPQDENLEDSTEETTESTESTAVATEEAPNEEEPEKVEQSVEVKDVGPCKKHVKVSVDRSTIDGRLNEKFSELVKEAVVPGFRPGKAPRKVIERQFQKDVFQRVKAEVLYASLEQLADTHDIAPLAAPDINPTKIDLPSSGPMIYEFDVEVRPEFELPDYKGMKLKRPVREITDEDVSREERRLLAPYGQLVPKDGAAEEEDYVIVDMTTFYGDKTIGKAEEITLRVHNRLAFKDGVAENFAEQVAGAKAGDTREVDITMSENVAAKQLAGLTLKANLEIKDVKTLRLPELTPEFLEDFGVSSEEQLRELLMTLLERRMEYNQRQSYRRQILEQIEAKSKLELPQDLLARQARRTLQRKAMEMKEGGMNEEEIRGQLQIAQQDILNSTALSLKEHFVLQKIAEEEKIDVSEDEINSEIEAIAYQEGESPRKIRARLDKEDSMETLEALLIERKALDYILGHAEYEDEAMEKPEDQVGVSEEQAVEGEMRDATKEISEEGESEEGGDDDSGPEVAESTVSGPEA